MTYNPDLAPPGARVAVAVDTTAEATTVSLNVDGLLPNRAYAAHLHARPCGLTGADAGPHYQHVVDPAATPDKPSVDPQFANMKNEIWLDFATDSSGHDNVQTAVPFTFGQRHAGPMITGDRLPSSVVIHEGPRTATEAGKAGIAGARIACMLIASAPELASGASRPGSIKARARLQAGLRAVRMQARSPVARRRRSPRGRRRLRWPRRFRRG